MKELDKDNYDAETGTGLVIVDFWGESCSRCLELMPDVHKLAETYGDKIKFCSLNIAGNRRLAMAQKVMGLPSFLIYQNGEKKEHLTGEDLDIDKIEQAIKSYI